LKSPHHYGKSLAIVTFPTLPTAEAGTRFSNPAEMQGSVDLRVSITAQNDTSNHMALSAVTDV